MPTNDLSIVIVEDSVTLAMTYEAFLEGEGYTIHRAETGKMALETIYATNPAVILLDLKLPDMDGLDILRDIKKNGIEAHVIVITAHGSVTTAVEAMQDGAGDFLLKPFSKERLLTTVRNAARLKQLEILVEQYKGGNQNLGFGGFIGESASMQAVYRMIQDAAPSKASVFIIGESGTGKELTAQAIHENSPRHSKAFIALNCAAIPANLIESEIFGHKRGAFTGATEDRDGAAVLADGGSLFLDEICEMPMDLQAKLLRFIQTGEIVPVGDSKPVKVNVRFICATNRLPWEEVQLGRFREDLYYRLHVIPIHMPPLRNRDQDVIRIAEKLLVQFARDENKAFSNLTDNAKYLLQEHHWPGNVRELSNVIQSAVVLNEGQEMTARMLTGLIGPNHKAQPLSGNNSGSVSGGVYPSNPVNQGGRDWEQPTKIEPLAITEKRAIEKALQLCEGKVRAAAKELQVNPSTLYRKIKSWDSEKAG